jgi:hypothetical protein
LPAGRETGLVYRRGAVQRLNSVKTTDNERI